MKAVTGDMKAANTRAMGVLGLMKQLGIHPPYKTDEDLLGMRGIGRDTLKEIRRLTGPCQIPEVTKVPQIPYGFDAWWKSIGNGKNLGVREAALAAWYAKADEMILRMTRSR